jgi:hypothetical protein
MKVRNTLMAIGYFCLAIVTAGAAAYFFKGCTVPDPAKMTADQIQTFITSQDFNSLPREQKRAFFEKAMDMRVENYFNSPPEDKTAYLDKIIDERENLRPPRPPDANQPPPNPDPNMMRNFQRPTGEQMRARREMMDPVKEAKRREFFGALRARSQQRGIQMGPPGGPGGGGPGGPPPGGGPPS